MKTAPTIFLLFIFLSANTAFGQLIKVPVLVHHYIEHQKQKTADHREQDNHLGDFISFLWLHYAQAANHDVPEHHHENLPFKNAGCQLGLSTMVTADLASFEVHAPFNFIPVIEGAYISSFHISAVSGNIWQPPRSC